MDKTENIEIENYTIKLKHDGKLKKRQLTDLRSAIVHLIFMYILGSVVDEHVEEITITRKHTNTSGIGKEDSPTTQFFWERYRLWEK